MVGWKRSESGGVMNEIGENVWNVEKNGGIRFQPSSSSGWRRRREERWDLSSSGRTLGRPSKDQRRLFSPLLGEPSSALSSLRLFRRLLSPLRSQHPSSASPSRPSQLPQPFASRAPWEACTCALRMILLWSSVLRIIGMVCQF